MANQLLPTSGEEISKADASRWITKFKTANPGAIYANFFGSEHLNKILKEADCVGIRVYNATGDDGSAKMVLVGAKADGSNIWPVGTPTTLDDGGTIVDKGVSCPPICSLDI